MRLLTLVEAFPQNSNADTMNYQRTLRIYEWISYILIIGATIICFVLRSRGAWALNLTICILLLAIFCRLMMERTRRLAADAENDQLKDDLRRLTHLYAEEKKKNAH
jgi:c-di-AMP phosphodiesterase-like protein